MTDLLTRLEQATEGSRELSDEVLLAAGWQHKDTHDARADHWVDPDGKVYDLWDDPHTRPLNAPPRPCPTTSLDAKLPWEDIRSSRYLFVEKLWEARHFEPLGDQGSDGGFWIGKAKTEVLARRIAALRARG